MSASYLQVHGPSFRRQLLRWFARHGRDLPWRRTRNPYHVLLSEFMLQQTQVARVEPYYHRFLTQYPTLHDLASAAPSKVRESWEGLGYYRRATNLHLLAQEIVRDKEGRIPSTADELRRLPGVGRYTAAAVASFAFEQVTAPVDTNVARVLRRAFHPRTDPKLLAQRVWRSAELLLPRKGKKAWAFNQAIMELGALVCTARVPRCHACPVRKVCATGRKLREEASTPASTRQRGQSVQTCRRSTPQSAGGHAAHRNNEQPHR
jgi:A/G-specific adenine glycosylase